MNALSILNQLKAEVLLENSYILTLITDLKTNLRTVSNSEEVGFDDYFLRLQGEVDTVGSIKLLDRVPEGNEGRYTNTLISYLEQIQDDCERVEVRLVSFQGRIMSAASRVEELATAFEAWFFLAAVEVLTRHDLKLPNTQVRAIAAAEFSRLMEHSNVALGALVEALKVERTRVTGKKKMAQKKFELGKEQVNAAWGNKLPGILGISPAGPIEDVYSSGVVDDEELDEAIPSFVSNKSDHSFSDRENLTTLTQKTSDTHEFGFMEPGDTDYTLDEAEAAPVAEVSPMEEPANESFYDAYAPPQVTDFPTNSLLCPTCEEPQHVTPSGTTCINSHGGVEGITEETLDAIDTDFDDGPRAGIYKTGTPVEVTVLSTEDPLPGVFASQPVASVEVDELDEILPASKPLTSPVLPIESQPVPEPLAPQRKPLVFTYEEDEIL
jgi:hypothetical protein